MFEFVRKHTKIMQFLLFILIVPSFILVGIDGYSRMSETGETVAKVDGNNITQSAWDAAHKQDIDNVRARDPKVDVKLLDSPEAKYISLERLVNQRVVAAAAEKSHLETSDQRLARELQSDPTIASLRKPDGTLDSERYRQLAASQGLTPEGFEARIRADLSNQQVLQGIRGSALSANSVADLALNAYLEKRDVQVTRFNPAEFAAKVSLTDADIETYYKANPNLFQAPEQASVEYVTLDLDAIKKTIAVNDADLKTYYEQNAARFAGQEQRRASHILITASKSAPAAERDKAKAKAQALQAEVSKAPSSFAQIAKANSQDPGSAEKGGDLDFFSRGAMTKPFEDAVFAMKKGEISPVVESDFGYHIIQLTDIQGAKGRSFEEVKAEITADVQKQLAQKKYAEVAEAFSNGVYEQADSLKPVADKLKLEIKTAAGVTRTPAPGATGVLANPKFLGAIFGSDAIEKKRNTEAIELGNNQLVSGRIAQYAPARALPLAEVKDKVRERLLAVRSAELAKKAGMEKLAAWKAAPASAPAGEAVQISRVQPQNLPLPVVEAALRADTTALPAFAGVDLAGAGYAVVKVSKVIAQEKSEEALAQQGRRQYSQAWQQAEDEAYNKLLRERFKTEIKVAKPVAKVGAALGGGVQ